MARKLIVLFSFVFLATLLASGCKAKKGCGCGNNLNYYKPRKSKVR